MRREWRVGDDEVDDEVQSFFTTHCFEFFVGSNTISIQNNLGGQE